MRITPLSNTWLWIYSPALEESLCEVDQELLNERIGEVVRFSLFCLAVSLVVVAVTARIPQSKIFTLAVYCMPLSVFNMIAIPFIDAVIAEKAANIKAVNECLQDNPSQSARRRIQNNIKAAELFVAQEIDINKHNLALPWNFETFKFLVDHGADIKKHSFGGISNFDYILMHQDPRFLEYIIKNKEISNQILQVAKLLISQKMDVNKQNLLSLFLNNGCKLSDKFEIFKLLIDYGADIKAIASDNVTNFDLAIMNEDSCFLEYILKNEKIGEADFTTTQPIRVPIGNPATAKLLSEYGFIVLNNSECFYFSFVRTKA